MFCDRTNFIYSVKNVLGQFNLMNSKIFEFQNFQSKKKYFKSGKYNFDKILEEKILSEKENFESLDSFDFSNLDKKKIVTCKIIERGLDDWCSSVIINTGKDKDLKIKDVVVYFNNGILFLVGQIIAVYQNYSKVLLISDIKANVSCFVPSKDIYGVLLGKNTYKLDMHLVDYVKNNVLEVGDCVFTSGMGGIFQSGIYIGDISSIEKDRKGNIEKVLVDLPDDFIKLKYVFVIKNRR